MVIATQNPEEHYGTYPLPESQMDRFLLRDSHRLPVARGRAAHPARVAGPAGGRAGSSSTPVLSDRRRARAAGGRRTRPPVEPSWPTTSSRSRARRAARRTWRWACRRAAQLAWRNAARAAALADGRDYVLPDDLKALALPVLAHRLVLPRSRLAGRARQDASGSCARSSKRVPGPDIVRFSAASQALRVSSQPRRALPADPRGVVVPGGDAADRRWPPSTPGINLLLPASGGMVLLPDRGPAASCPSSACAGLRGPARAAARHPRRARPT